MDARGQSSKPIKFSMEQFSSSWSDRHSEGSRLSTKARNNSWQPPRLMRGIRNNVETLSQARWQGHTHQTCGSRGFWRQRREDGGDFCSFWPEHSILARGMSVLWELVWAQSGRLFNTIYEQVLDRLASFPGSFASRVAVSAVIILIMFAMQCLCFWHHWKLIQPSLTEMWTSDLLLDEGRNLKQKWLLAF